MPGIAPTPESWTGKDAKNFHLTADLNVFFAGLGSKPTIENIRRAVAVGVAKCNELKMDELSIVFSGVENENTWTAITEAAHLANYQFNLYKTKPNSNSLKSATMITHPKKMAKAIQKGTVRAEATSICRDLVNEPVITLTAPEFSNRMVQLGKTYGFQVEVFNKAKIQSLKMGGLLAVNFGSEIPPTFTILEYKGRGAKNKKPIVLIGKGVVYDTGGLSLKETAGSMDYMKSDMAGAGAVVGAFCGIASLKLPVHVIGLIPATDNRPGKNAYVPGDVITMFDGTTVEVMNTDAEGRLILADALGYAKKYAPELVIDLATLTGAAVIAVGHQGTAMFAKTNDKIKKTLKTAGDNVHERLVEFPLWEEYRDQIKSDIADLKNVGGKPAGSITAAKFLEHFTDYPWIHLDIAGPSFIPSMDSYRGKNATGVGVRMLIEFIDNYVHGL